MEENRGKNRSISQLLSAIPASWAAFAGALLVGLAAHGMGMLNKYSWHDDIQGLFLTGATITSGRWMLHVLGWLEVLLFGDGHFSLPLLNGLVSLICIGLSAGIMARMLRIRSRGLSALMGGVMSAFPVITALFGFVFTIHYYMISLLMMTCGAYLILEGRGGLRKTAGTLLGGCAVGIYQAFLPVGLALILLGNIVHLTEGEETGRAWKRLGIHALCFLGMLAVYAAGSRLFLTLHHLELDSYMGLSQAGSLSPLVYLQRMGRAWREFFLPTRNVLWDMYPQHIYYLRQGLLLLTAALSVRCLIRAWRENRGIALLLLLLLAAFPLACNLIFVLSGEVHSLMTYGQVMQIALLVCLADRAELSSAKIRRIVPRAATLLLSVTCLMYVRFDNQCYLKTEFQQQQAITWYTALISKIKSAEGYRDELPVIWRNMEEMDDQTLYNMDELNFLHLSGYEQDVRGYVSNWAWEWFLARWCGFSTAVLPPETADDWPEVQEMPHYPDDGSIRVLHDAVVVNF